MKVAENYESLCIKCLGVQVNKYLLGCHTEYWRQREKWYEDEKTSQLGGEMGNT